VPELPEVETIARQLAPVLTGRAVRRFALVDPMLRDGPVPRVAGRRIDGVRRSGKRVLLAFGARGGGDGPLWLAVHLRMTGRLLWTDAARFVAPSRVRARFELDRGRLLFCDTRRLGTFTWYRSEAEAEPEGVDPLSRAAGRARVGAWLAGSREPIKTWLMRQDRLAGIGNIYASEILFAAGVDPRRPGASLEVDEVARLVAATRTILRRAIRCSGTTFSDFQDARGEIGSYGRYLRVYDREDEPCSRCGTPIRRVVQQQRSTYFCPGCQR